MRNAGQEQGWADRAVLWGACALFLAINLIAAVVGRELETAGARQMEVQVLAEDQAACERLLAPPGSERFLGCIAELARIRQGVRERSDAQDLDLL